MAHSRDLVVLGRKGEKKGRREERKRREGRREEGKEAKKSNIIKGKCQILLRSWSQISARLS